MVIPSVKTAIDRAPRSLQGDRGRSLVCARSGASRETFRAGRQDVDVDRGCCGRASRKARTRGRGGLQSPPMMTNLRQNLEGASREAKLLAVELLFLQSLPLAHEVKSLRVKRHASPKRRHGLNRPSSCRKNSTRG